jgi:assimilatory nitrate reductase catalytic subunit
MAALAIAGDPEHPANRGKLCSKGTHLGETLGLETRLLQPMIASAVQAGTRRWTYSRGASRKRSPSMGATASPSTFPASCSTEDYYVANKLMKGFIGSSNIDTNSRLVHVERGQRPCPNFGEDVVPVCYDDIDEADLILLVGSNTCLVSSGDLAAHRSCARGPRVKLVVIDPRRTETAERADCISPSARQRCGAVRLSARRAGGTGTRRKLSRGAGRRHRRLLGRGRDGRSARSASPDLRRSAAQLQALAACSRSSRAR